jgi:hypothetical protein
MSCSKSPRANIRGELTTRLTMPGVGSHGSALLRAVIVATKTNVGHVEAELKAEIAAGRAELRNLDARLTGAIGHIAARTLIRLCGVLVVLLGLLFAALHAWPPR